MGSRTSRMEWSASLGYLNGMLRGLLTGFLALIVLNGPAAAQLPRVGSIDFYGLRTLKPADLAGAVGVQIGDSLAGASQALRQTIRERLLHVQGVAEADVSIICCEAGRVLLYVGVREAGVPAATFDAAPAGPQQLPEEMIAAEREYLRTLMEAIRRNEAEEEGGAGHALQKYPPARAMQQQFIVFAAQHEDLLRDVLHNAADAHHRAVAALIIAYAPDKTKVVGDLIRAVRDPDSSVRNNAIRALGVMAAAGISVPLEPFIALLNSVDWTDRNKASFVLTALTADRDAATLALLRERALDSLLEMARWRSIGHAAPAGIILGRMAGIPEDQIFARLMHNRDEIIDAVLRSR